MKVPVRRKQNDAEAEIARLLRQFAAKRAIRDAQQVRLDEAKRTSAAGMPQPPDLAPLYRELGRAIADGRDEEEQRLAAEIARLSEEHDAALRVWHVTEPQLAGKIEMHATAVNALNEALVPVADRVRFVAAQELGAAYQETLGCYLEFARQAQAALVELKHLRFELRQLAEANFTDMESFEPLPMPVGWALLPQNPAPDGPHARGAARVKALREAGVLDALRLERAGGPAVGHTVRGDFAERV